MFKLNVVSPENDPVNKILALNLACTYIPSVNELYDPNWKAMRMVKSQQHRLMHEQLEKQLRDVSIHNIAPWIREFKGHLRVDMQVIMRTSFNRRDCDNTLKSIQDFLFSWIGKNDSRVLENYICKFNRKDSALEYITVKIYPSRLDPNFFLK